LISWERIDRPKQPHLRSGGLGKKTLSPKVKMVCFPTKRTFFYKLSLKLCFGVGGRSSLVLCLLIICEAWVWFPELQKEKICYW
jgi:hypothetical protein